MATRAQRQNKIQENQTIYVSWHVGDPTSQPWVDEFWLKIEVLDPPHPPILRRSDKVLAGDKVLTVDEILAGVTDIVAVVTGIYIKANKEGERTTDRECARFIELMDVDKNDILRAWVAPLQQFPSDVTKIGGKALKDFKRLIKNPRLKDPRFALPPNDTEIYQAVVELLGLD
jgi:hypothetical protein